MIIRFAAARRNVHRMPAAITTHQIASRRTSVPGDIAPAPITNDAGAASNTENGVSAASRCTITG